MSEAIKNALSSVLGENVILVTIVIAMLPLFELRGAIPIGMAWTWGANALNAWQAYLFAYIGSCAIVPILALIFTPIMRWLKSTKTFRKIATSLEKRLLNKQQAVSKSIKLDSKQLKEEELITEKKKKKALFYKMLCIIIFVAIPIPFTGVWTGTCIAAIMGLSFWHIVSSVMIGNAIAGGIIAFLSYVMSGYTTMSVFYTFLVIAGIILLIGVIKYIISYIKEKKALKTTTPIAVEDVTESKEQ